MRGYFGIGIYHPKTETNMGTLWRSAQNFGASFIFTIGKRYQKQSSDTTKAYRYVPPYHYKTFAEVKRLIPYESQIVAVEQTPTSQDMLSFEHPERTVYLLGAEEYGIPSKILKQCQHVVHISTPMCLNVAVAGSLAMFHRNTD